MADKLPKLIVIKSVASKSCAYYMNENEEVRGYVRCAEESVFATFVKIEVEASNVNRKYVHLRFCHSNKYWERRDNWIVATSDQPEENTSKLSCTLFEPSFGDGGKYLYLNHVQSGGRVGVDDGAGSISFRVYVDEKASASSSSKYAFTFVDWDTLVKLPKHVTFKGENGMYLKGVHLGSSPFLQFSGGSLNDSNVAYEVYLHPDGHLRIKSVHFEKFWRRSSRNWIWGDQSATSGHDDVNTLFWPAKINGRTIALRNAGNNNFCKRFTREQTSCLYAELNNITNEARLIVEELVLERSIYNVRYRMEDARVYDEHPFVADIGSATNDTDFECAFAITVSYTDTRSSSFTNTLSMDLGVKTTIQTGFPLIAQGKIEISASVTNTFQWGQTTETSTTAVAAFTVIVPARSKATVNYVGTQGKCSVPFSYTQQDKRSNDGSVVTDEYDDGIFYGVNCYSFHFEQPKFLPM